MPFNTSTRLYSLLSERINVHICNEKGLTQFVSNLCFSYGSRHCLFGANHSCDKKNTDCSVRVFQSGRSGETCQPRALPSEMLAVELRLLHRQSLYCLFWVSRSCDKKTRTVMSVFFSLVGVARLELAALRSRTVRATKLRYTPFIVVYDCFQKYTSFITFLQPK